MRLITRNDTSLTVALLSATVILFRQPLRAVLNVVEDIQGRFQLDLLPALLLLVVVFTFHQYRKREHARAAAVAAAADAAQARTQSRTLKQLMTLGRALANALDPATLQQVLWKHLTAFIQNREFWVLIRRGDRWEIVVQDEAGSRRPAEELERLAARALSGDASGDEPVAATANAPGDRCFPMLAGGTVVGVLGVSGARPLTAAERDAVDAAAAVIAIGVKNMLMFLDARELSLRDGLTGCFNRAYALEALDAELRRARRTGGPLSILMFDVDHFKTVNDRHGHLRGDELLGAIGARLGRVTRSTDVRCRYGGDEFLVILPETPSLGAQQVAEVLRKELADLTVGSEACPERAPASRRANPMAITVSIGVAGATAGELDAKALIDRADKALYRAKSAGRNRVGVAVPPSMSESQSGSDASEDVGRTARGIQLSAICG